MNAPAGRQILAASLGEAMSRRRAASPTPAEIRQILRGIARDERIAQRRSRARYRALERRFRREREARMRAEAALAQKFRDEEAERKRQQAEWDREQAE